MTVATDNVLLIAFLATTAAASPSVTKVEPPEWWADHSVNPVRLCIRGANLHGAEVHSTALRTGNVRVNPAGTYLFVDVAIPKRQRPGTYNLEARSNGASVVIPFRILPRLPRQGRFQGFSAARDVMYLIMPDRFSNGDATNDGASGGRFHGGDLQGIINRLPYLRELGATALWLNPVYDNSDRDYHGYGPIDFYAVDEHFGTLDLFRKLVDAAHRAGIRIIQDQLANHTGPLHPWVQDPPTATWYHDRNDKTKTGAWFLGILPDLNHDDPEVERYLIQNTLWWIERSGIDGIRQDTVPYVSSEFWRRWNAAIAREYPNFRVVGEIFDRDPAVVDAHWRAGGFSTVFDFPLYYAIREVFLQGKPAGLLNSVLARDSLYPDARQMVTHLGLHDVPRIHNTASAEQVRQAFAFLLTTRGLPLIYYGDEIGMRGGEDPDNRRDFPQRAFASKGRTAEEQAMFTHVQALIRQRLRSVPARPTIREQGSTRKRSLRRPPD